MVLAVSSGSSTYKGQLGALAVTSTDVYFADGNVRIETSPIVGGSGTAAAYSSQADTTETSLTTDGTSLYWADRFNQDVEACALGASCPAATTLASLFASSSQPEGIAVSGSTLYFGAYAIYTNKVSIQSVPVGGGAVTTLCTVSGASTSVNQMLIAGGNLYFTSPTSAVHVCPLATPGVKAAAFWTGKGSAGLATDGTDLFWTVDAADGSIMKCALGATCAKATTIAAHVKNPAGVAVSADCSGMRWWKSVLVFHK